MGADLMNGIRFLSLLCFSSLSVGLRIRQHARGLIAGLGFDLFSSTTLQLPYLGGCNLTSIPCWIAVVESTVENIYQQHLPQLNSWKFIENGNNVFRALQNIKKTCCHATSFKMLQVIRYMTALSHQAVAACLTASHCRLPWEAKVGVFKPYLRIYRRIYRWWTIFLFIPDPV